MTTFSRYYDDEGILQETTMEDLQELLTNECNKSLIAHLIYQRYYHRYLKIFDFEDKFEDRNTKEYDDGLGNKKVRSVFNMEYKNGFVMMASCCLLIETLASFLNGTNKTENGGVEAYKTVFQKASAYGNQLAVFEKEHIYGNIRCGLLHQGETYKKFKIRRDGSLFEENTINATLFFNLLKIFFESYRDDLSNPETKWDGDLWDKCRVKLRFIIENTQ